MPFGLHLIHRRGPQVYQSLCELQLATLHIGCEAPQGTGVHECNCTTGSSALTISFSLHLWCTIFANLCTFGASGVSGASHQSHLKKDDWRSFQMPCKARGYRGKDALAPQVHVKRVEQMQPQSAMFCIESAPFYLHRRCIHFCMG